MKRFSLFLSGVAALSLSACATTGRAPVDATRYHLDAPIERMSFTVEPLKTNDTISPEYAAFSDAVRAQLVQLDFPNATDAESAGYVAGLSLTRAPMGVIEKQSPFRIGIGGGSFGRNVGVGGGASVGLGGGARQVIGTELAVQLRRRSDDTVVWEGRAITQTISGEEGSQSAEIAQRLAGALFKNFPGESGITITVK
ncbi:DUF4136 domain-containing protein [Stakelama sp. CBK3Z-3]|uniref:DUF4136 domain-containing protein n=1 Tax=Stakelama flava TaxID=2860338 RepID=A0ABS6XQM3_9SPHN|nr:DUF4136 domain-containing protein [Stakelama flava]MBW4332194.1 DUF4136 domain-containing protein [Stakelama flava]